MFTLSPLASPAQRFNRSVPFSFLCVVGLAGALALSSCSAKKSSDTSTASSAGETTVAAKVAAENTVVASVETSAVAADSSGVNSETTLAAAADPVVRDSLPTNGATPTSVDPQAAMEAAIVSGMSSQLGVTDPKQLACVGDSVKGADFTKPEGQGKILRGVLKCAPDAMAVQGAKALREANPSVTEKQSVCVVKATFEVLGGMADSELVSAMSSSKLSPVIVEATLAKAKGCGLSDAEIRKAIQQ